MRLQETPREEEKKTRGGWNQEGTTVLWSEVDGVPVNPDGESRHERVQAKGSRMESEAPGEEGEEVKCPIALGTKLISSASS